MVSDELIQKYEKLEEWIAALEQELRDKREEQRSLPITKGIKRVPLEPIWIDIPSSRIYGCRMFNKEYVQMNYVFQDSWSCWWKDGSVTQESFDKYSSDRLHGGHKDYDCPEDIVKILVTPFEIKPVYESIIRW